jgi:hypothetical protein
VTAHKLWRAVGLVCWAFVAPFVALFSLYYLVPQGAAEVRFLGFTLLLLATMIGGLFVFFMHMPVWQRVLVFCVYTVLCTPAVYIGSLGIACTLFGDCL